MPCSDVTEELRLVLTEDDQLDSYELIKRSCGRAVGERTLLGEVLLGCSARDILSIDPEDFAQNDTTVDDAEFVLRLKHLLAVQGGLRVLLGLQGGSVFDPVRVGRVAYDEGGRCVLEAELAVDVLTDQIKACGKCRGCGTIGAKHKMQGGAATSHQRKG